jgi:phosphoribosylamine---glycine ligase
MNILLLGSGGREHAIAWKTEQSPLCSKLFIAPGNAGTELCGTNVAININDFASIADFIQQQKIEMVVVGPEEPLVKGITDYLKNNERTRDVLIVGPDSRGAMLEGSKDFAKEFMVRNNIPTAAYKTFTKESFDAGIEFLQKLQAPYVLKADGLAAGKGVLICATLQEAIEGLKTLLLDEAFGQASSRVVIEEYLDGIEVSVFVATDGKNWILLPSAKDYKRIGEGDTGPNTGGMGAVSPVPFADSVFMEKVKSRIIQPTIDGLIKENIDYKGFVFLGLMNVKGDPYVIEYNVRLGDPETEAIMPLINSDVVEMFKAMASGNLDTYHPVICPEFAVTIVMVSGGYPGDYKRGMEIKGLDQPMGSSVFLAGAHNDGEKIITNGGRVLTVTSLHSSLDEARKASLENAGKIQFEGSYFRKDIGLDLLK